VFLGKFVLTAVYSINIGHATPDGLGTRGINRLYSGGSNSTARTTRRTSGHASGRVALAVAKAAAGFTTTAYRYVGGPGANLAAPMMTQSSTAARMRQRGDMQEFMVNAAGLFRISATPPACAWRSFTTLKKVCTTQQAQHVSRRRRRGFCAVT